MWPFKRKKRDDAWHNSLTGVGTARDKRTAAAFGLCAVPDIEARTLWRGDPLAARVIETLPREMTRRGFCVKVRGEDAQVEDAKQLEEDILAIWDDLDADDAIYTALCYERAYGGAAIWPVTNDSTGDLAMPLNEARAILPKALHVFEPSELVAASFYEDITSPKFGLPETYYLTPRRGGVTQIKIHESRLIVFYGQRVSREDSATLRPGWGDSALTRFTTALRDFQMAFAGASALLSDASQAVWKMTGLIAAVARDGGSEVLDRMEAMDRMRSVTRAVVLDADTDEDFERKPTSFDSIPQLLEKFMLYLAAAGDMPVSLLMGQSALGMNATGEGDRVSWYDRVNQAQRRARGKYEQLVRMILLAPDGPTRGKEPGAWRVEFKPLLEPTEKELAEIRKIVADTDAVYLDRAVMSPAEARTHWSGDEYSIDVKLDEEFDAMIEERTVVEHEQAVNPPVPPPAPAAPAPPPNGKEAPEGEE